MDFVPFPESVFMLGGRYEFLSEAVRSVDRQKHLSLRDILDATPPVWVRLAPFSIGQSLVTNGEYLQFLDAATGPGARLYDSAAVWRHVWQDLNLRIERFIVPFERAPGEIVEFQEDYTGARGAVDAYLASLRFEIQRMLITAGASVTEDSAYQSAHVMIRHQGAETRPEAPPREELVRPAFALARYLLRGAILLPGEDPTTLLSEREQQILADYATPAKAADLLTQLVGELRKAYRNRVDVRYQMAFQSGHFRIEPVDFLQRLREQVRRLKDLNDPISLRLVMYPRYWQGPEGRTGTVEFVGGGVPWEEQPVTGITLYEAAAFAAWLGRVQGRPVMLPNEAQIERASSWPLEELPPEGGLLTLDPSCKLTFPWEDHNPTRDFNYYFGKENAEIGEYFRSRKKYQELLQETSRLIDSQTRLFQLDGFGWQWTRDRYSEDEFKYMRFQDPEYPRCSRWTGQLKGGGVQTIYDYQSNSGVSSPRFALKGSPDVLGGPGLTARRYAASPLRAYPNVSFRVALQEDA
jgi:formylglycine-generating enzyme required for sulfatase activity